MKEETEEEEEVLESPRQQRIVLKNLQDLACSVENLNTYLEYLAHS